MRKSKERHTDGDDEAETRTGNRQVDRQRQRGTERDRETYIHIYTYKYVYICGGIYMYMHGKRRNEKESYSVDDTEEAREGIHKKPSKEDEKALRDKWTINEDKYRGGKSYRKNTTTQEVRRRMYREG